MVGVTALRYIHIWGMGLLLVLVAGCSVFDPSKPVKAPEQSVKNSVKSKKQEKEQAQAKNLMKPIAKVDVTLSSAEQEGLEEIKSKNIIYKGSSHSKRIALTFDDGPDNQVTLKILDILRKEKVRATFFVTGRMVKKYPHVLKRIDQEGHIIGNHTWTHPQLTKIPLRKVRQEVQRTTHAIEKQIGKRVHFMRPPYGATNAHVVAKLKKDDYYLINWNVDTYDWKGINGKKIIQTVKDSAVTGSIVLQHNSGQSLQGTVDALPEIIHHFKDKGYEIVPLDQLLDLPPYKNVKPDVQYAPKEKNKQLDPTLENEDSIEEPTNNKDKSFKKHKNKSKKKQKQHSASSYFLV